MASYITQTGITRWSSGSGQPQGFDPGLNDPLEMLLTSTLIDFEFD